MFQQRVVNAIVGRDKQYRKLLGKRKGPHTNPYGAPFRPAQDLDSILDQLQYKADLPPVYLSNFVELHADGETLRFLEESLRKYHRCWATNYAIGLIRSCLNRCYSHTDVIGMLNIGFMHVISAKQMSKLLLHSLHAKPIDIDLLQAIDTKMVPRKPNTSSFLRPNILSTSSSLPEDDAQGSDSQSQTTTSKVLPVVGTTQDILSSHRLLGENNLDLAPPTGTAIDYSVLTGQSHHTTCESDSDDDDDDEISDDGGLSFRFGSLLDIGSGSGRIPRLFQSIMTTIDCTESSKSMVASLRKHGFRTYDTHDINTLPPDAVYNNITLFNLIDRCDEPITLLFDLHKRLTSYRHVYDAYRRSLGSSPSSQQVGSQLNLGGRIIIACPLPLRPSVEDGTTWRPPSENIAPDGCFCCFSFEESLRHLILNVIDPCGYAVLTISRVPYLSEGNLYASYFALDDVILVITPKDTIE